ncbi:hypothetical protein F7734_37890 [Scytonema sp. UIC 10036]|uniref:hypothetical protein n=1 Tax=Scytonema sp. UIC 10036 TaxID=2304196 RepID=UPI0012DA584A|nr:hypothetical protein [Scytonema sp. UIC 10036]MUG97775.1 hypothetical protein [Scytonema sp. UIC 10036]
MPFTHKHARKAPSLKEGREPFFKKAGISEGSFFSPEAKYSPQQNQGFIQRQSDTQALQTKFVPHLK